MLATSKTECVEGQHVPVWRSPDTGEVIVDDFVDFWSEQTPQMLATSKTVCVEGQHVPFWRSPDTGDMILEDFRDWLQRWEKGPVAGRASRAEA